MKNVFIYSLLFFSFAVMAQQKDKNLPKGNEEFKEKKYAEAEADYRISLSKSPTQAISSYNLGNTIYKQNQASEAKLAYLKTIENAKTKPQKHKAFHNLGNIFMKEKKYSEAVEAYKNALRNNPTDEETRYNYALAKEYLKNNPPPKDDKKDDKNKDKNQDKDKKEDNKEDKKDGDDKKDNKDKGDNKDKKDEGKDKEDKKGEGDDKDGQPKPQPANPSKQRIDNLLDAVNNEEKKIQDKVNAKKAKGRPVQTEKDW